ncbi:TM1812 family CRISPR-associated protein [Thermus amyloliquefaciens]|uniref:TM1812 family CRISPR-associated protein n=1 Tax=Thermus amyloliquefaciens TaxID=1449080 RepID=UPI00056FB93E|nr:TM1812 family CRISPR-associated protein [Thermus amyloliquefaciens]
MEKLILSFLGVGNYQEVPYRLDGKDYATPYTQEALAKHYPDHTLKVLLTQKAREKHGEALRARVPYQEVPIPDGRTEEELWRIFNAMAEAVPGEARLVLDISHGFRSQPILGLAVAHFLRVAKGVEVERIVYGLLLEEEGRGEFLDLTPFLELLSWTEAARDLFRHGFGRPLGELLKGLHRQSWLRSEAQVRALGTLGNTLDRLSLSLELLRVQEAGEHARGLLEALERVKEDLVSLPRSQPLGLLLDLLEGQYRPLAVENPFTPEGLRAQAAMVDLLLRTGSLAQAVALMRELVVSVVCLKRGFDPVEEREAAERLLGAWSKRVQTGAEDHRNALGELWGELSEIRNDTLHASMRKGPTPAETLENRIQKVWPKVRALVEETSAPNEGA